MRNLSELTRAIDADALPRAFLALGVAKALSRGYGFDPMSVYDTLNPRSPHRELIAKAVTEALTTDDLTPFSRMARAFVELVQRRTILGRAIGLRRVPPLTRMLPVTAGVATAAFVVEGAPIPVDALHWDSETSLTPGKLAIISVYTKELAASPEGIGVVERDLLRSVSLGEDFALLDGQAAVEGGRPASILNGLSPIATSSSSTIEDDVAELIAAVREGEAQFPTFIASSTGALWLARQRSANGERLFPNVTVLGGNILGIPLMISPGATFRLVLFDAAVLLYTDLGAEIVPATQASLQFVTDPQAGPQDLVSLFQTNTIALRCVRYVSWLVGASDGAAFIELPAGSPA